MNNESHPIAAAGGLTGVLEGPDHSEYRIDNRDQIESVQRSCCHFATQGARAFGLKTIGSSLWDSIQNDEICELYRLLIRQVRSTGQETSVPIRCETPDCRRPMQLTLVPEANGKVTVRTAAIDDAVARAGKSGPSGLVEIELLPVCAWCSRVSLGPQGYCEITTALEKLRLLELETPPKLTHTICPECFTKVNAEIVSSRPPHPHPRPTRRS